MPSLSGQPRRSSARSVNIAAALASFIEAGISVAPARPRSKDAGHSRRTRSSPSSQKRSSANKSPPLSSSCQVISGTPSTSSYLALKSA